MSKKRATFETADRAACDETATVATLLDVPGLADEIANRMALPQEQWIPLDNDTVFDDVINQIRNQKNSAP